MTRYELYINDVKVDIGGANISLNYKSNLLTDISKIVSNNSYTIKLPKTAKNLSLMECSHIPSAVSRFPYLKHKGTILRNGIEIVKNANIVLLSVGESIEIAVSWGNVTSFASVVNDGKKLTDLQHGAVEGEDWVVWENWGEGSTRFPRIDYGINSGDSNIWRHPVEFVWWILEKIKKESGITFKFPPDKEEIIHKMIVPLLTRNDSQKINDKYPSYLDINGYNKVVSVSYLKMSFAGNGTTIQFAEVRGHFSDELYPKWNADIRIKGEISMNINARLGINPYDKILRIHTKEYDAAGNVVIKHRIEIKTTAAYVEPPTIKLVFRFDESIHVDSRQFIDFIYESDDITSINNSRLSLIFSTKGDTLFGERFPIVPNLPDIKQIDFIKAIASMVGLFALPDGDSGIKFISFDSLNTNKSKAADWTDKVIMAYRSVTPRNLKYTLDNLAQNNRLLYKEDSKVSGIYDGNIQIEDTTIDYERDAIKLPFSACDSKGGVAYIPLYSYNDKGELQYNKANPRLLLLDKNNNGVFQGLEWDTLITNNYQTYSEMVNNAKVVTEYVRLNSIELRDLEMDVPVYLGQYGSYFAIIEIKTRENDICECKLLKI